MSAVAVVGAELLFARTLVFGLLLLASPQICETVVAPLAFAMGGSKSTSEIFAGTAPP